MEKLHRSISSFGRLCVNQDAKIATIRAVIIAIVLATLLLTLMRFSAASGSAPDFTSYSAGEERKEAFFSYFLPLIEEENEELLALRQDLLELQEDGEDLSFFQRRKVNALAEEYEVEDFDPADSSDWDILIRRIDLVPPSLALAQAANESAWGTSRFAQQGNNFYGQWCFVEGCGIVPAQRPEGASHEVADFSSPQESVERYIHNLNHHPAYTGLREKRELLRAQDNPVTGLSLVSELESYSERGDDYIQELAAMIRFNELNQLDTSPASTGD